MSDCPEPEKQRLACMKILGQLEQGQRDAREWMTGVTQKQNELAEDVAYMRGKLDALNAIDTKEKREETAERRSWGRMTAAVTAVLTAIAGAIAAIWKLKE